MKKKTLVCLLEFLVCIVLFTFWISFESKIEKIFHLERSVIKEYHLNTNILNHHNKCDLKMDLKSVSYNQLVSMFNSSNCIICCSKVEQMILFKFQIEKITYQENLIDLVTNKLRVLRSYTRKGFLDDES